MKQFVGSDIPRTYPIKYGPFQHFKWNVYESKRTEKQANLKVVLDKDGKEWYCRRGEIGNGITVDYFLRKVT